MKLPHLAALALTLCASHALAEQPTLRLYNWADYFAEDTLSRFTAETGIKVIYDCLLYTSPSPRDGLLSRMPSSA